ncbi:LOG family protein [Pseudosulfitobacter koreensis]|uniref:Cytokinin riboside 5'-monophosphate phosphoribohydrolase n=1 Tax=Pseudosulfitobacter koreensis TaxID=2968472 RepID=A0ABT1YWW6_9RHOB|nr:TIGR00730 family Rossman fold protein [Pseudosulfitobacter koreense]MCR8825380.1 TIGR00730 family Rossman fold protein [Pseudosulfitobacter koreense]
MTKPADHTARHPLRHAGVDRTKVKDAPDTPQTRASAYKLAFADDDFLCREELRPVRLQLELLKTTLLLDEQDIRSTIVLFGGARIPAPANRDRARTQTLADLSHFYDVAQEFAHQMTLRSLESDGHENIIVTGGGPGVMEAGNRGASEAGGKSIGLSIVLPHEQAPNAYVTPELCFNFHYFAIRKMHFLMRARAICVFPGGFGTMDEMFEALTLIQTGRMERVPFLLFGRDFWEKIINWEALADAGTISPQDLELFRFVETAQEAMDVIDGWETTQPRETIPGR